MSASDYVDQAVQVLGGEATDFMLDAQIRQDGLGEKHPTIALSCRAEGCAWGFTVGQMELWEFITDARDHWESTHAAAVSA